jgi:hypothetical protein
LGFIYCVGIQNLASHMVVHGYEVATEYEKLLNKGRFSFPLSHHFKTYDT